MEERCRQLRRRSPHQQGWVARHATRACFGTVIRPSSASIYPVLTPVAMAGVVVVTDSTSSLTSTAAARSGIAADIPPSRDRRSQPARERGGSSPVAAAPARAKTTPGPVLAFSVVYDSLAAAGQAVVQVTSAPRSVVPGELQNSRRAQRPNPGHRGGQRIARHGHGFAALSGAECASRGGLAADVAATIRARAEASTVYFYVSTWTTSAAAAESRPAQR